MFTCKQCHQNIISVNEYIAHIKLHKSVPSSLACSFENCCRSYGNIESLRSHLKSHVKIITNDNNFDNELHEIELETCIIDDVCNDQHVESFLCVEEPLPSTSTDLNLPNMKKDILNLVLNIFSENSFTSLQLFSVVNKNFQFF